MKNKCRVVGDDRVFNSSSELAKFYNLSHSHVIYAILNNKLVRGRRFELVDLPKMHRWFRHE